MSWKRWIAGFDLHGDKHNPQAVSSFLDFTQVWKPHVKVFGGDLWDFRPLRNGASKAEQAETMTKDFEVGMTFLREYKPHFFIHGNHDFRLWDTAENSPSGPIRDAAQAGCTSVERVVNRMRCRMLPYHKKHNVLDLSHTLRFFHGFAHGVNAVRTHANIYNHGYHGHIHAFDTYSKPSIDGALETHSVGALCQLDMPYAFKTPSSMRHGNGWVYGLLNEKTGEHVSWMAKPLSDGSYMLPTEIKKL